MKMRLGILEHFDAGHHLPGHPRCGTPHGHTYKVELTIEGENKGEMIVDFAVLKERLRETLKEFDHVDLNGVLPYPTCENICEAIYQRLEKRLGFPFHLRVWEGEGKWAEIWHDDCGSRVRDGLSHLPEVHTESDGVVLGALAKTPAALGKLLRGLAPKALGRSYAPGKWTIRQIVCHLRDCELIFSTRFRKVIAEEGSPLPAFDQDRWAEAMSYSKQDPKAAFELFRAARDANVALLRLAGRGALDRGGEHPTYGRMTLRQLARHIMHHDRNHLGQVATARASR